MRGVYERHKGSGVWWIRWHDHEGRRHREKAGRKSSAIRLYQKRKTESLERRKLPELFRRRAPTFGELAEECLAWSRLHKRSYQEDVWRMRRIREHFGRLPAESITPEMIDRFLAAIAAQGKSPATVNRARSLISVVFRLAVDSDKVLRNPVRKVKRLLEPGGRVRFLSAEEEGDLRGVVTQHYPQRLPELDIALNTGLRQGAQYGLTWEHVDLERGVITIPLSKPGERQHIPINSLARRAFRALRGRAKEWHKNDIIMSPAGRVFDAKSPRGWFGHAVKLAGIQNFRWHDLRHTAASRAVMEGVPLRSVQEFLGHKTAAMTLRYAHLSPEFQQTMGERLAVANRKAKATRRATRLRQVS